MFIDQSLLDAILRGLLLPPIALIWIIVLVRVNGLRSFSKMTNFDFVTTVAMGSLLAGAGMTDTWTGFLQIFVVMAMLFVLQASIAKIRQRSDDIETLLQNQSVLLMRDGVIDDEMLRTTRVSRGDLIAKLREANVLSFDQVRAVVLETTGDVAVLHGEKLDDDLLEGVGSD